MSRAFTDIVNTNVFYIRLYLSYYNPAAGCSVDHKSRPNCISCRAVQAGGIIE